MHLRRKRVVPLFECVQDCRSGRWASCRKVADSLRCLYGMYFRALCYARLTCRQRAKRAAVGVPAARSESGYVSDDFSRAFNRRWVACILTTPRLTPASSVPAGWDSAVRTVKGGYRPATSVSSW